LVKGDTAPALCVVAQDSERGAAKRRREEIAPEERHSQPPIVLSEI